MKKVYHHMQSKHLNLQMVPSKLTDSCLIKSKLLLTSVVF